MSASKHVTASHLSLPSTTIRTQLCLLSPTKKPRSNSIKPPYFPQRRSSPTDRPLQTSNLLPNPLVSSESHVTRIKIAAQSPMRIKRPTTHSLATPMSVSLSAYTPVTNRTSWALLPKVPPQIASRYAAGSTASQL
ncbi:hypothetical protein BS50DRAFT_98729 [Corynespora cassiicola Philippines]|uniref:Uncharacterized protein n=1 Tax=Corynespora cassiicola Philippines TaxID=1448308 RepID=A0A2T2NFJ1_CORCC|nr:hypothetical protein BS50DRAFT_98729 [Corynespora cassiicola Philippines]